MGRTVAELPPEPGAASESRRDRRRFLPDPSGMQFVGIVLVVLAALAAELASLALELQPGSAFLWWLNLQLFRGVNAAIGSVLAHVALDYRFTIPGLLGLLAVAFLAFRTRHRFGLAILSNAAFIWSGFNAFVWYSSPAAPATAGLVDTLSGNFSGWLLMAYIATASLLGFLVTHLIYWRAAARFALRMLPAPHQWRMNRVHRPTHGNTSVADRKGRAARSLAARQPDAS